MKCCSEALALAKLRLPESDDLIREVMAEWGRHSEEGGNAEQAAKWCCTFSLYMYACI